MIFGGHPYNKSIPDKIDLLSEISLFTAIVDNINVFSAYIITLKL